MAKRKRKSKKRGVEKMVGSERGTFLKIHRFDLLVVPI